MKLKNYAKWQAVGSKKAKKLFMSLLIRNGFKSFDGKKTAQNILLDGAVIKHVDISRRGERGNFFISSDTTDKDLMLFDLDKQDIYWCLTYILDTK